ncbi:MAG TPA: AraC family transcriptional regulator [Thermomicrobiales bacterium]|nr:AraC family transcriptional regulator [Thermomicrobiales bacterium]
MDTHTRRPAADRRDDARLWRTDALGGLELLRAHFVGFHFAPHAHEEFMVVATEAGAGVPRFWGATQRVGPGDLFVLGPDEVHAGGPAEGAAWRYRSFYPPAALLRRVVREVTGADRGVPHFARNVVDDPATAGMLRRAHRALEGSGSALAREASLLEALAGLVVRHAADVAPARRAGHEHRAVRLAQEYLEALPGENVSLDTLACAAGIGSYHLCRVFRQETGLPPHAYQLLVRVRHAKALLGRGVPIAQVAADTGFADQAHLTRHFKRIFGVTPGRYLGQGAPTAS